MKKTSVAGGSCCPVSRLRRMRRTASVFLCGMVVIECHGYAGQGTIAGARIGPPVLNAQGMIRYIRRPAGAMPAFTDKVSQRPGSERHLRLSEDNARAETGEGHSVAESDALLILGDK